MEKKIFTYVGTWTVQAAGVKGGGIGIYEYNPENGALTWLDTVRMDIISGKMCVDQARGVLYVVDETVNHHSFGNAGGGGRVLAFKIDAQTGALTELNEQPTFGTLPAYLALDATRNWLVVCNHSDKQVITNFVRAEDGKYHAVTNYSRVTAVIYPIAENGCIMDATDIADFGQDYRKCPPQNSCLHYVGFAHDGEHFLICNMKQDMVLMYRLDREHGTFIECDRIYHPEATFPHYGVLNEKKHVYYINNEHAHVLNTVSYDSDWKLKIIQTLDVTPVLSPDMAGKKVMQTDIGISADGKTVYDLFRGPNSVWVFDVDQQTGFLSKKQELLLGGKGNPRGFAIAPDRRFMLVADNDQHIIVTLRILEDGTLETTGLVENSMKYPGNLQFYQA